MLQAPAPPTQLVLPRGGIAIEQVPLSWTPSTSKGVAAYFVYRGQYPGFVWERVGTVTSQRSAYLDEVFPPLGGTLRVRYAVSAVDLQGNESGLARVPGEVTIYSADD